MAHSPVSSPAGNSPTSAPTARYHLSELICRRTQPGADLAAIDAEIWQRFGQTRAVMFTDLAGFSRQVEEFGIIQFLQVICESERLFEALFSRHQGKCLKRDGDSMLVIFPDTDSMLHCAIAMGLAADAYNQNQLEENRVRLCLGLGFGPMLVIGDEDVYGAEVNAASKLGEDTAKAGEILVTDLVAATAAPPGYRFELCADRLFGRREVFRLVPV